MPFFFFFFAYQTYKSHLIFYFLSFLFLPFFFTFFLSIFFSQTKNRVREITCITSWQDRQIFLWKTNKKENETSTRGGNRSFSPKKLIRYFPSTWHKIMRRTSSIRSIVALDLSPPYHFLSHCVVLMFVILVLMHMPEKSVEDKYKSRGISFSSNGIKFPLSRIKPTTPK